MVTEKLHSDERDTTSKEEKLLPMPAWTREIPEKEIVQPTEPPTQSRDSYSVYQEE